MAITLPSQASLTAALLALRCDYAALASVALADVVVTGVYSSVSLPALVASLPAANTAQLCPAYRRLAAAAGVLAAGGGRSLVPAAAAPYSNASIVVAVTRITQLASILAAVGTANPLTSFPRTDVAWPICWNVAYAQYKADYDAPFAVSTPPVPAVAPLPAPEPGLSSSQQLGLCLGIGLGLALVIAIATICTCHMMALGATRAATQLSVAAPTKAVGQ